MIALAEELGLSDELSFHPVGVGFFIDGKMYPFNGIGDFLRFPPLSPPARARLAWFVAPVPAAPATTTALEDVPLKRWLARHCGRQVVERIWEPLLNSRFDSSPRGAAGDLPVGAHEPHALGARQGRRRRGDGLPDAAGTRRSSLRRRRRARSSASDMRLGAGVEGLVQDEPPARSPGCRSTARPMQLRPDDPDAAAAGARRPAARDAAAACSAPTRKRYLGVVCLILKLTRSLTALLLDQHLRPDADHDRRRDLARRRHRAHRRAASRLPAEVLRCRARPSSAEDDESIYRRFTEMLASVWCPTSADEDVVDWTVQRAPLVEPVHALGHEPRIARSGPASRASRSPRPARSTRACSTASRLLGWPSASPRRRWGALASPAVSASLPLGTLGVRRSRRSARSCSGMAGSPLSWRSGVSTVSATASAATISPAPTLNASR